MRSSRSVCNRWRCDLGSLTETRSSRAAGRVCAPHFALKIALGQLYPASTDGKLSCHGNFSPINRQVSSVFERQFRVTTILDSCSEVLLGRSCAGSFLRHARQDGRNRPTYYSL